MSRKLFPEGDPIGRRIHVGTDPKRSALEVVGVVADASVGDLRAPHHPVIFRPKMQEQMRAPVIVFETASDPESADAAVASVVTALGHEYPRRFYSMNEHVDAALIQERLLAGLSGFFALMALLLAFVGLHGSLAYGVAQRSREIGLRVALGASRSSVVQMILREGLTVSAVGAVVGVAMAFMVSRVAQSLLFGVEAANPWIAIVAAVSFVAVGAIAGLVPAARAANGDPATALRSE